MSYKNRFAWDMQPLRKINVSSIRSVIGLALFALFVGTACSTNNNELMSPTVTPTTLAGSISANSGDDCCLGFCFTVVDNRTDIEHWRIINISLNEDDFSLDNIKRVVKYLSKKYTEPGPMMIEITTDPDFFKQASHGDTYYKNVAHYLRRDAKEKMEYTKSLPTRALTDVDLSDH